MKDVRENNSLPNQYESHYYTAPNSGLRINSNKLRIAMEHKVNIQKQRELVYLKQVTYYLMIINRKEFNHNSYQIL